MAVRADVLFQIFFEPLHSLLVLDLGKGVLHGIDRAVIIKIHLRRFQRVRIDVMNMMFFQLAVVDNFLFLRREITERHVGPHAHRPHNILHQRPHERSPNDNRTFVDCLGIIRYQRCLIYSLDNSCSATGLAGTGAVESKLLRAGAIEFCAADRAGDFLHGRDRKRRRTVMSVGTAVACKPGKHQPQTIEQLRKCTERAADAGNSRPLAQRKRRRYIPDIIHIRPFRLRHSPARIGREGFQIPAGSLRIQRTKCKRRFSRTGDTCNRYNLVKRDIYIDIFKVMNLCAAYLDILWQHLPLSDLTGHNNYLFSIF